MMILNELFYFCHEEKVTENILFNNIPNFIIIFLLFSSLYFISLSLSQCFLLFTGVTFLFVYFCLRKKKGKMIRTTELSTGYVQVILRERTVFHSLLCYFVINFVNVYSFCLFG